MEGATHKGVSEAVSERQQAIDELVASRGGWQTTAEETPEVTPEVEREDEKPEVEAKPDHEPEEEGYEFFTPDGRTIKVPKSARFKAKIDGQETEADVERTIRGYQKGAAADKRLEEAARRAKELQDYERTLAQRLENVRQREAAANNPPQRKPRGDLKQQAEKLYKAVMDEVDDPVSAIADALAGLGPDEDEIVRVAEERAAARAMAQTSDYLTAQEKRAAAQEADSKRNAANLWFTEAFPEIVADKHLVDLAKQMGAERISSVQPDDYKNMVKEIGDELMEWRGKSLSQQTREKPRQTPPTARTAQVPKKPELKPITRADILAEMKQMRGQPA